MYPHMRAAGSQAAASAGARVFEKAENERYNESTEIVLEGGTSSELSDSGGGKQAFRT